MLVSPRLGSAPLSPLNDTMNRFLLFSLPFFLTAPAAAREVDFARDDAPLFARACLPCHGAEKQRGGLRLGSACNGSPNYGRGRRSFCLGSSTRRFRGDSLILSDW